MLVCMDETHRQQVKEVRVPRPAEPSGRKTMRIKVCVVESVRFSRVGSVRIYVYRHASARMAQRLTRPGKVVRSMRSESGWRRH